MSSTIIIKNSATSGSVPSSLVQGEFGINVFDGKLYYGSGSGNVVKEFNTSSFSISSSYALSSSYAVSASYGATSSYANNFNVAGTLTAASASITYLTTVYETSSVIYSSGSNQFGDESSDIQTLWGTVDIKTGPLLVTGSASISGSLNVSSSFTASGLRYPSADNGEFSFIQTDGLGNLSLKYVNTLYETIYNAETSSLVKGTPVYVSGSQGANPKVYIADAGNPAKMPVIYISADNIASGATGRGIALGLITGVDTTGYPSGTTIYVAAGGGWTATRPTGSATVQVLGIVTKEGAGGQGVVLNPGPVLLPNLPSGSVWVGNSGSFPVATPTSSLSVASASFASSGTGIFSGSFSGSFQGNGSGLTNISASAIVGLNLSQIATGSVSASVSAGTASFQVASGSTNFLYVSSSGNIGIGTTTPTSAKLQVSGSNSERLLLVGSPASSSILFVTGSGLVGIGTNTPEKLLHLKGDSTSSDIVFETTGYTTKGYFAHYQGATLQLAINRRIDGVFSNTSAASAVMNFVANSGEGRISLYATNTNNTTPNEITRFFGTGNVLIQNGGTYTDAGFRLDVSGSARITNGLTVTGSFTVTTGSLVEFQVTNTGVKIGNASTDTHTVTGSLQVAGQTRISGSFNTAVSGTILTVVGSGSTQPIFTVQGSQGELFSVTDSLTGSLFSVNDISGLPILEVFSDSTTNIGNYLAPAVYTTNKITQTNSGSFVVYSLPTASYDGAFYDYTVRSGSNARAGQIMAIWSGSSVNFTETTTTSFGSTSAINFTVIVSGSNMVLTGSSATGSWTIKTIIRSI